MLRDDAVARAPRPGAAASPSAPAERALDLFAEMYERGARVAALAPPPCGETRRRPPPREQTSGAVQEEGGGDRADAADVASIDEYAAASDGDGDDDLVCDGAGAPYLHARAAAFARAVLRPASSPGVAAPAAASSALGLTRASAAEVPTAIITQRALSYLSRQLWTGTSSRPSHGQA